MSDPFSGQTIGTVNCPNCNAENEQQKTVCLSDPPEAKMPAKKKPTWIWWVIGSIIGIPSIACLLCSLLGLWVEVGSGM